MPYTFLEHTSDIRMQVSGKTLAELFSDALLGMVKIMNPVETQEKKLIKRKVEVEAPDTTALLVDFLSDALAWMHRERGIYTRVQFQTITERALLAELEGSKTESFGVDIKAVTYHEANVQKAESGEWSTVIIFDI
jgi:SHS2 domain-containing protein